MMKIDDLNLMGSGDACRFLDVNSSRLSVLVRKYKIPHLDISSGRVFLREDLEAFQMGRRERLRFKNNHNRK